MNSISTVTLTVLMAVCWTASTSAQLDFFSPKSAPMGMGMADLMMTGSELNPRVEPLPPQKLTFDPSTLNRYQGPFAPQFYMNSHNQYQQQQQQQNLYGQADIPISAPMSIPITTGNPNSIDQIQFKSPVNFNVKSMLHPKPNPTGVQTIQNRLLTLQELMSTPLFAEYMRIPLFRQFVSTPAFQSYLSSPLFQQYWSSPLFKSFFSDSAHFFKNIYPLLNTQLEQSQVMQPPQQFQPEQLQQEQQYQYQYQPHNFNNVDNYNNYNDDLYTEASTPFVYHQGQGHEQGQFDPEFQFQLREQQQQEQRRLRRRDEMPLFLWNLISAARQQKQQQQFQADPQIVMQAPSSLTFDPSTARYAQGQVEGQGPVPPQFQPEASQIQTENQPEILMMVVTEEDKDQSQTQSQTQPKKIPQLERLLLERILRTLFLNKIDLAQKQEEIRNAFPVPVPVSAQTPVETKLTFVNGDKDNVELKDMTVEKAEETPTILIRGEPVVLNTNTEINTDIKPMETETEKKIQTELVDIPQEPTDIGALSETELEMNEEDKLKTMKKMKLMKLLKANKRFIKMNKDKDAKMEMNYSPASEITFTTSSPLPLEEMEQREEMMTGAEEKIINKIPIPSPAVDPVPVPFTSFDIRPRRQSYSHVQVPTPAQNQKQDRMTAIPVNSPQFLQIVQMLRNQQQQEHQQQQQQQQQPTVYRLNSFEGQNSFLGSSLQNQPSKFHYTIADRVAPVPVSMPMPLSMSASVNSQNPRYETTGTNGLYSIPLTRGQPIYQTGYPQRYAVPINNNYETYSV